MSMDTLDKVQCVHGKSPVRPARLHNVYGLSGHCTLSMESVELSMDSMDSLDIVHGHTGQSPGIQADWTMSMDKVH